MDLSELVLSKPITKAKLTQFEKKGISDVRSLLRFEPNKYYDYSNLSNPYDAENGTKVALKLTLKHIERKMGNKTVFIKCTLLHETGLIIGVTWFDRYKYQKLLSMVGKEVLVAGEFQDNEFGMQILNPDVFEIYNPYLLEILPIYPKIQGMSVEYLSQVLDAAITQYDEPDFIGEEVLTHFNIISEKEMINKMHKPKTLTDIKDAKKRIIFEDIYRLAKGLAEDAVEINRETKYTIEKVNKCEELISLLPYELTEDQSNILNSFISSAENKTRINALIQGDVGSGKTIVAILLMTLMAENGYQATLMAPTGILARQHFAEVKKYMDKIGITTAYLGGDTKPKEKREILERLKSGEIQVLIGTHAVISDDVTFKNLAITIVDEEHKFGVKQRNTLKQKAKEGVHSITMSATPIPRSLANTLYSGACDVFTIETMPSGRKPVKTAQVKSFPPMLKFMEKEINQGHQCYMVCPLIEEKIKSKDKPYSVEEIETVTTNYFKDKGITVKSISGKLKDDEKDAIISSFVNNECQILIATTIIEVGVNVPNATVISIINAERFGLAGLHQLRGRVGRSDKQSYCMLFSTDTENPRLNAMCKTTNGFEIAEIDLQLRGTGDLIGTRQSGEDKKITYMLKYPTFFTKVKNYIMNKLKERKETKDMPDNFEIIKPIGTLSESTKGWTKELNLISWYGKEPKYDIRDWSPNHEKMGKGITLNEEEFKKLGTFITNEE